MKYKKIRFIIFFLSFICSLDLLGKSKIILNSIDYPREITVKTANFSEIKESIKISYKYFGKEIVSNYGRHADYYFHFFYDLNGGILYYDSSGSLLSLDDSNSNTKNDLVGLSCELSGNYIGTLFANKKIYSFEIPISSTFPDFDASDTGQFIKKKAISYVVICIGKVILDWEEIEEDTKSKNHGKPFRGGRLILNVNKTIKINVKYEDATDIKASGE